jgi:hypothetical protein
LVLAKGEKHVRIIFLNHRKPLAHVHVQKVITGKLSVLEEIL